MFRLVVAMFCVSMWWFAVLSLRMLSLLSSVGDAVRCVVGVALRFAFCLECGCVVLL